MSDSPTHTGPWRPPSSLQIPSWAEREVGTPTASGSWSPGVGLADCVSLHSFDHPSSPSLITSFTPYVLCERSKFFSLNISTFSSVKWDTEPLQSDAEDRLVNRHSATRDTITPTGLTEMKPSVCVCVSRVGGSRDFPDGPVPKILPLQGRGTGSIPGQGTKSPCASQHGQKIKFFKKRDGGSRVSLILCGQEEQWIEAFWRMVWHHQSSGSTSNPIVALLTKYSRDT